MMKTAKTTLAILLALCMLLSLGTAAFADDPLPTLNGDLTVDGSNGQVSVTVGSTDVTFDENGNAQDTNLPITKTDSPEGPTVTVNANIVSDYNGVVATAAAVDVTGGVTAGLEGGTTVTGVEASGQNTTVSVGGSVVNVTGDGVEAIGSTVSVTGDVAGMGGIGIQASDGSTVIVGGGVTGNDGVNAEEGSTVNVTGSVTVDSTGVEADGSTVTITGGVTAGDGIVAEEGSTVSVTGNVSAHYEGIVASGDSIVTVSKDADGNGGNVTAGIYHTGIEATGEKTLVSVEGDVTAGSPHSASASVRVFDGATVEVGGDVKGGDHGVEATNGSTVTVGGVSVYDLGISASSGSTVTVSKNVTSENDSGVFAKEGSTVNVTGDVSASLSGISANNGGTVTVGGDVKGGMQGIYVHIDSGDEKSTFLVEGTVSADEDGYGISLAVPFGSSVSDVEDVLPEIIVQSIDTSADYLVCVYNDTADQQITQAVLDSIMYIVETVTEHENSADTSVTASLGGGYTSTTVGDQTLDVATTGSQLTLAVDGAKGDIVGVKVGNEKSETNPDGNVITKAEDGSWVITVGIGGGLKIIATIITPEPEPEPQPEPKKETKPQLQPESRAVKQLNARTSAAAPAGGKGTISLDYGYENPEDNTLIIDMTEADTMTILTETLRRFQRTNRIGTVKILVGNGSYTIAMADLLKMLGTAPSLTLVKAGDALEMRAGGVTVTTLVMTSMA